MNKTPNEKPRIDSRFFSFFPAAASARARLDKFIAARLLCERTVGQTDGKAFAPFVEVASGAAREAPRRRVFVFY
jgi:hypothetical protein